MKGTITKINQREDRYGFSLGEKDGDKYIWYNGWGTAKGVTEGIEIPLTEGDEIEFEHTENSGFRNVKGEIKITKRAPAPEEAPEIQYEFRTPNQIMRGQAMECVSRIVASGQTLDKSMADTARDIYNWIKEGSL